MLVIEVTNAREVVRKRIGRLGGRLIGKVVREFGIEARIFSVDGPQMLGRSHLEIPVQVREEREVRLP